MSASSRRSIGCLVASLLVCTPLRAQIFPLGQDFQVNSYTSSAQRYPGISPTAAGGFVVVWESLGSAGTDTDSFSIQGRSFTSAGTPVAPDFQVNVFTTNYQRWPAVGPHGTGGFVVVWQRRNSGTFGSTDYSIQGRRFDSASAAMGSDFQINTYTTLNQLNPAVGTDGAGGFLVVWESQGSPGTDNQSRSIQGRRYDAAGAAAGLQFQINNDVITNFQDGPAVIGPVAGGFVVVWRSLGSLGNDTNNPSIQGQRLSAAGAPLGQQFQVNSYTTGQQDFAAVGLDGGGGFVVVWRSFGAVTDPADFSIQGQRYAADGTALGPQFQVNSYTTGHQLSPKVGPDAAGGFVVLWDSYGSVGNDSDGRSVQAQRYASSGEARGAQFQVNSYTTSFQSHPALSLDGSGGFVVAWQSSGSAQTDQSSNSIQARRVGMATETPTVPLPTPTQTRTPTVTPTTTVTPTVTSTPQIVTFNIPLEGCQEFPPNSSQATGSGAISVNLTADTLTYNVTHDVSGASMAHIHGPAARGANAGILHNLGTPSSPISGVWNYSPADEANILAGLTYVNVHSGAFPSGEIRGQIDNIGSQPCPTATPTRTPAATATITATATNAPPAATSTRTPTGQGGGFTPTPTPTGQGGGFTPTPTPTGQGGGFTPTPTPTGQGGGFTPTPTPTGQGGGFTPTPTPTGQGGGFTPTPTPTGQGGGFTPTPTPTGQGGGTATPTRTPGLAAPAASTGALGLLLFGLLLGSAAMLGRRARQAP